LKKSLLSVSIAFASLVGASAHAASIAPAKQPAYQALPFQLTKPVDIADVYKNPVGGFEAYVEVPDKGACTLTRKSFAQAPSFRAELAKPLITNAFARQNIPCLVI
jgi:hypothetical protein